MSSQSRYEREQEQQAAREAAEIGGPIPEEDLDPAERPVREAGGGEAEGFEEAEDELIEHASHGDQQSAHAILHHQGISEEDDERRADSEADQELSSELDDSDGERNR
ncbi:MAG: hypothetical protein ACYCU0_00020 [Solirubrobacteraceae bacterium]